MKKLITSSIVALSLFGAVAPTLANASTISNISSSDKVDEFTSADINIITNYGQYSYDKKLTEVALKLENYFSKNEYGDPVLYATKEQLMEDLEITEQEAEDILSIAELDVRKTQFRGFVGLYINLGSKIRSMNGWAAALVTASAAALAKWGVENGVTVLHLGDHIPGISLSYNVYIP
ncbi:hypothetical protein [Streptococcus pseudopneumoniae]|uniref:Uncharacterized protein n=1 Tax=Streptococcus pseudopneumoniae TaxID=257758 RepID=A0A2P0A090_9STRE|nr:hypothetical protein [Streptococcus pseudopneumoniae]CEY61538.1 Uncharacterised protein [Streptococcus pseudopneumoniae]CIP58211.1 Uncharacterised protein [Streptococcus pseudopneumoniae]COD02028.1 Uncharacterised protein [Streptococcus pseudopneumoniae]